MPLHAKNCYLFKNQYCYESVIVEKPPECINENQRKRKRMQNAKENHKRKLIGLDHKNPYHWILAKWFKMEFNQPLVKCDKNTCHNGTISQWLNIHMLCVKKKGWWASTSLLWSSPSSYVFLSSLSLLSSCCPQLPTAFTFWAPSIHNTQHLYGHFIPLS